MRREYHGFSNSHETSNRECLKGQRSKGQYVTDTEAAFEHPDWYVNRLTCNIKVRARVVGEFLRNLQVTNVLDIGCGDGSVSIPLLARGARLTLLDRSEAMVGLAKARIPSSFASKTDILRADFLEAPLEPATYDLIICLGVLPYVQSKETFIEKIISLLTPNGTLITDCTDRDHLITRLRRWYSSLHGMIKSPKVRPVHRASIELLRTYQSCGLRLNGAYRYSLPPPGVLRLLSPDVHCRVTRLLFGSSDSNRNAWLGNEWIFRLKAESLGTIDSSGSPVVTSANAMANGNL